MLSLAKTPHPPPTVRASAFRFPLSALRFPISDFRFPRNHDDLLRTSEPRPSSLSSGRRCASLSLCPPLESGRRNPTFPHFAIRWYSPGLPNADFLAVADAVHFGRNHRCPAALSSAHRPNSVARASTRSNPRVSPHPMQASVMLCP
jgi:hypothetical protein